MQAKRVHPLYFQLRDMTCGRETNELHIDVFGAGNGAVPTRYYWLHFWYDITELIQEHVYGSIVISEQWLTSVSEISGAQVARCRWRSRESILNLEPVGTLCQRSFIEKNFSG